MEDLQTHTVNTVWTELVYHLAGWLGGWVGGWVAGWVGTGMCVHLRMYRAMWNASKSAGIADKQLQLGTLCTYIRLAELCVCVYLCHQHCPALLHCH